MTKAQQEFITREGEDSRNFETWYHNDDIQRIVWAIFQRIPEETKKDFLEPYVFFDGDHRITFDTIADLLKKNLLSSNKHYFLFIINASAGNHYLSGLIRRDSETTASLFLFDPLATKRSTVKNRLSLQNDTKTGQMPLILSNEKVQDKKKEGDKIVSCGPFNVLFVQYCLENPTWIKNLPGNGSNLEFKLPNSLSPYAHYETLKYREQLELVRQEHYELLAGVEDAQLEEIESFYQPLTSIILDKISTHNRKDLHELFDGSQITSLRDTYFNLLTGLKIKIDALIRKGSKENRCFNLRYTNAAQAAQNLYQSLEEIGAHFLANPNGESFQQFERSCREAIATARPELEKHRGIWNDIHPILKGILGIFAILTVIPAIIITKKSSSSYMQTFFGSPPTRSATNLCVFEKSVNEEIFSRYSNLF